MTLWPGISRGAEECRKSTVHLQMGGLSELYPVWLFLYSSAEFSSVCHDIPHKVLWEIAVEIVLSVVWMFSVVLKPSSELRFGWWSCSSNLPYLTLAKVHQLAIFQMHREGNDGRRPTAHGKIEQPPAGFTCPYTLEVLVLANLIASFRSDLVSWCITNHCTVVTFVDVFEGVFAGFDRRAGLNINVASLLS